ncbi:hypothetical protein [Mesorhizobium sp. M0130]|uniref:hypothetical protein n=1 Tax=unclassified Mesorhizobium TaxID=325217 RepID=UPI003337D38C
MSGSAQCPHVDFQFEVKVARFDDDTIKQADITGRCINCDKPLVFFCDLPMGVSWTHPTLSTDAQELRLPVVVLGDEVDEAKPRPSFSVREVR